MWNEMRYYDVSKTVNIGSVKERISNYINQEYELII